MRGSSEANLTITVAADPNGTRNNTYANDDANIGPVDVQQTGDVETNDNDPEGDIQTVGQVDSNGDGVVDAAAGTSVTLPSGGTVTINSDGTYVYDPAPGFVGTEQIVYQITDGTSTDNATLYLTTLPKTEAENDINQTPVNTPVDGNVQTNDIDPQGDAQTVTEITYIGTDDLPHTISVPSGGTDVTVTLGDGNGGTAGTLAINKDGEYTYTPETDYTGNVPNVTYEVLDATGAIAKATLDIDVIPTDDPDTNEPPVANDDTNTTDRVLQ